MQDDESDEDKRKDGLMTQDEYPEEPWSVNIEASLRAEQRKTYTKVKASEVALSYRRYQQIRALQGLNLKLIWAQERYERAISARNRARASLSQSRNAINHLAEQLVHKTQQLANRQIQYDGSYNDVVSKNNILEHDIARLKEQLAFQRQQKAEDQRALSELKQSISALQGEKANLTASFHHATNAYSGLQQMWQAQQDAAQVQQIYKQHLQSALGEANKKNTQANQKNSQLSAQYERMRIALQRQIAQMKQNLASQKVAHEHKIRLAQERHATQLQDAEQKHHTEKLSLIEESRKLSRSFLDEKQQLSRLINAQKAHVKELESKIAILDEVRSTSNKNLQISQQANKRHLQSILVLQSQKDTAQRMIKHQQQRISELQYLLDDEKKKNNQSILQLKKTYTAHVITLTKDHSDRMRILQQAYQLQKLQISALSRQIRQLQQTIDAFQRQLSSKNLVISSVKEQQQATRQALTKAISELANAKQQMEAKNASMAQEKLQLLTQISALRSQIQKILRASHQKQQAISAKYLIQLAKQHQSSDKLTKQVIKLKQRYQNSQNLLIAAGSDYQALKIAYNQLQRLHIADSKQISSLLTLIDESQARFLQFQTRLQHIYKEKETLRWQLKKAHLGINKLINEVIKPHEKKMGINSVLQQSWQPNLSENALIMQYQLDQNYLASDNTISGSLDYGKSILTLNEKDGQIWIGIEINKQARSFYTRNCVHFPKRLLLAIVGAFERLSSIKSKQKIIVMLSSHLCMIKDFYKGNLYYSLRMVRYYKGQPQPTRNGFNLLYKEMKQLCDYIQTLI